MKKTIEKETTFCDICGKESFVDTCLKCGKDICWECIKKVGVEFPSAVFFSGSGDGHYCKKCNIILRRKGNNALYNAYLRITLLRQENEIWYKDFKQRCDKAEAKLQELIKK